ncbi:hypothetical protein RUND412_007146 [Rhizina undulata]
MKVFGGLVSALAVLNIGTVLAAPKTSLTISASTSSVEANKAAVYYPPRNESASALLIGNDKTAATGGFRTWSLYSELNSTLAQLSAYTPGRTKLVTVVYDITGKDLIATLTIPDSLLRLYDIASGEEVVDYAKMKIWGDFSAFCGWRVKDGEQYLYFFGKKIVCLYLLRATEYGGIEVVEITSFPVPIEGAACTVSQETSTVFFGGDSGDMFTFPASQSTSAPAITTAGNTSDEIIGLDIYSSLNGAEYLFAAHPETIEIFTLQLELLGTVSISADNDFVIKDIAIYQQFSAEYPQGALAYAVKYSSGKAFAVSSLVNIFTDLSLTTNISFTPRSQSCKTCSVQIASACSTNGYSGSSGACDCFAGFSGISCSSITCINDCSSKGTCTGANVCTCNSGWGGPDCSWVSVQPKYETDGNGEDGDDPAIWIAPDNVENSRIITTTKSEVGAGLGVFDLTGKKLQTITAEEPNNVDVIYGFPLGNNRTVDLAYAACRGDDTLCLFEMTSNGTLVEIAGGVHPVPDGFSVYGSCVYYSPVTFTHYLFVNSKTSEYLQYSLSSTPNGTLTTALVRSFFAGTGGQVEGCVGDSDNKAVIISEEPYGLWSYGAEADAPTEGYLIDTVSGNLFADVEGVTMVNGKNSSKGFLLVSCQGYSAYAVYRRTYPYDYVLTFSVKTTSDGLIDHVTNTDGLAAVGNALNSDFPKGLVVIHDDANENPDGTVHEGASFKLVSLEDILGADFLEEVDTAWDPRKEL